MKTRWSLTSIPLWLGLIALIACASPSVNASAEAPTITRIAVQGASLIVDVDVPAGVQRLTLETRAKVERGAWTPRTNQWHDGTAAMLRFEIPVSQDHEMIRVRAEDPTDLPFPASFFRGQREFEADITTQSDPMTPGFDNTAAPGDALADRGAAEGADRDVAESDIWHLDGNTLYFFNAQRGLQVLDLTHPDDPILLAQLSIDAYGEQLYVLPARGDGSERWIALLARDNCNSAESEVLLVRFNREDLVLERRLPVLGNYVHESRRVGDALYVASAHSFSEEIRIGNGETQVIQYRWRSQTILSSFDLSDPSQPVVHEPHVIEAHPQAISATDEFLFVATTGPATTNDGVTRPWWLQPGIHSVAIFDIRDPSGVLKLHGAVRTRGRVQDKFKLHHYDTVLSVVSQEDGVWMPRPNGSNLWTWTPPKTWLETFSAETGVEPVQLGSLKIIENETLFATRFVGHRAYVVTFLIIDPLWIIDLSNPAQPEIKGELEIPGWSSYLHPLGTDRLVAMGVEGGQAAVALFDVADDSNPQQLSKVYLGDNWSWSEANQDEKAFRVLPDANLILVPWQGQEGDDWVQAVQLIDLIDDKLIKRGLIHHPVPPRRATLVQDRIVSISSRELVSVDFSDRDLPEVTARLELGYRVDRVWIAGDSLLLLSNHPMYSQLGTDQATLRVVDPSDTDIVLGSLVLPSLPVVGGDYQNGVLHLVQFQPETYRQEPVVTFEEVVQEFPVPPFRVTHSIPKTNWVHTPIPGYLLASTVDFDGTTPTLRGSIRWNRPATYYGSAMHGLWVDETTIVWTESQDQQGWYGNPFIDMPFIADGSPGFVGGDIAVGRPGIGMGFWYPWFNGKHFWAIDVADTTQPTIVSRLILNPEDRRHGFTAGQVVDGKIFMSYRDSVRIPTPEPDDKPGDVTDDAWIWWPERWETRSWLQVLDYADSAEPVSRQPVGLPGELIGVARGGALLITRSSTDWSNHKLPTESIAALAYDGLAAHQISEFKEAGWMGWKADVSGAVRGFANNYETQASRVGIWSLNNEGQWEQVAVQPLEGNVDQWREYSDLWLAIGYSKYHFFHLEPGIPELDLLGTVNRPCHIWPSWADSAAGRRVGLWLPRGDQGIWHIPVPE